MNAHEIAQGAARRLGRFINFGSPFWDEPWDILVILDACRADLMAEVAPRYGWLHNPRVRNSPASSSSEFLHKHIRASYLEEIERTALVSANAHTRLDRVRSAPWSALDEVWRHSWDGKVDTVLPRAVTDAAVRQHREGEHERLIVWYMQPHQPFVPSGWHRPWDDYRHDRVSKAEVWAGYRENLEYVLAEVDLLRKNVDGRMVITADHGHALGELGLIGHPPYIPMPVLKRVPWIELDAIDTGRHQPAARGRVLDASADERLEALGYI